MRDLDTNDAHGVNLVLTFEDQDGNEWLAGAYMTPLKRSGSDEHCEIDEVPDRVFQLRKFHVVVPPVGGLDRLNTTPGEIK